MNVGEIHSPLKRESCTSDNYLYKHAYHRRQHCSYACQKYALKDFDYPVELAFEDVCVVLEHSQAIFHFHMPPLFESAG